MSIDAEKQKVGRSENNSGFLDSLFAITKKIKAQIMVLIALTGITAGDPEEKFKEDTKTDKRTYVKIVRDKKKHRNI